MSKYAARNSTGLFGRSLTSACIPCSRMGTTLVSRYWRMGIAWTSILVATLTAAFSAAAAASGSSWPASSAAGRGLSS